MEPEKRGRPTKYTDELADYICQKIADGITLSQICREDNMPNRSTVYDWVKADEVLSQRIARAREVGFDAIADDCLKIADDNSRDETEMDMGDGIKIAIIDHDHIQRSKLRVDTRLKLLSKWAPHMYGEKMEMKINNNGDERPSWLTQEIKPEGE